MEQKNYTLDWKLGIPAEVNSENIKEMANVMLWYCRPCTYKDDEVTAVAGAHHGIDGKPNIMLVSIGGKTYDYTLNSKRVSEKMGKEIIDNIIKAVEEYKESMKNINEIIEMMVDEAILMDEIEETIDIFAFNGWMGETMNHGGLLDAWEEYDKEKALEDYCQVLKEKGAIEDWDWDYAHQKVIIKKV